MTHAFPNTHCKTVPFLYLSKSSCLCRKKYCTNNRRKCQ